jgi:hypothetical protein
MRPMVMREAALRHEAYQRATSLETRPGGHDIMSVRCYVHWLLCSAFRDATATLFGVSIFGAYALLIVLHRQPPMLGDFGDWLLSGKLLALHLRGFPDPTHSLKHFPVPNSTLTLILGLLCSFLPWNNAARVYLLLQLAFSYFSVRSLISAVAAPKWIWFIAPGAMFLSLGFWYGLFAFQLGVSLLFLFAAILFKRSRDTLSPPFWILGLLLLALFFTHMLPFTFACLLLILFAWQTRQRTLLVLLVPPAGLLIAYITGRFAAGDQDSGAAPTAHLSLLAIRTIAFKANTVAKSFGFVNPVANGDTYSAALQVFGKSLYLSIFVINLFVCAAILVVHFNSMRRGMGPRMAHRFFWIAQGLCLLSYLVVPESLLGISDPGARVLQVTLWTGLFLCDAESNVAAVAAAVASAGSALMAIAGLVLFALLGWNSPPPALVHLPTPIEMLGKVPYQHTQDEIEEIERGKLDRPVAPTGLFLNKPQDHPPAITDLAVVSSHRVTRITWLVRAAAQESTRLHKLSGESALRKLWSR